MVKKRRRRKRIPSSSLEKVETPESRRSKFPNNLIKAFLKFRKSNYSEKSYNKYRKLVKKFLGKKFDDPIEQCGLVVDLARATSDLHNNPTKTKKRNKK